MASCSHHADADLNDPLLEVIREGGFSLPSSELGCGKNENKGIPLLSNDCIIHKANPLFSELINDNIQYIYENSDEILNFGKIYYIQLIPLKNGQLHGEPSDIISIFIPNIIAPQLSDIQFYYNQ